MFNEEVEKRFEEMEQEDFDIVLLGYQGDVPFDRGSVKLREMFAQRIVRDCGTPEDFVVMMDTFVGNHSTRANK